MFIVYVGAIYSLRVFGLPFYWGIYHQIIILLFQVMLWLWITLLLFANFAESLAESRSKAQAASLRGAKQQSKSGALTAC